MKLRSFGQRYFQTYLGCQCAGEDYMHSRNLKTEQPIDRLTETKRGLMPLSAKKLQRIVFFAPSPSAIFFHA